MSVLKVRMCASFDCRVALRIGKVSFCVCVLCVVCCWLGDFFRLLCFFCFAFVLFVGKQNSNAQSTNALHSLCSLRSTAKEQQRSRLLAPSFVHQSKKKKEKTKTRKKERKKRQVVVMASTRVPEFSAPSRGGKCVVCVVFVGIRLGCC